MSIITDICVGIVASLLATLIFELIKHLLNRK